MIALASTPQRRKPHFYGIYRNSFAKTANLFMKTYRIREASLNSGSNFSQEQKVSSMINHRTIVASLAIASLCISIAIARGPGGRQGGPQGGPGGGPAAMNGQGGNGMGAMNGMGQCMMGGGNMADRQNMPTIQQLAQTMLTTYDADGNKALDQAELQTALAGLRQMMMQNAMGNGQMNMMQQNQNGMMGGPGAMQGGPGGMGPGGHRGPGGPGGPGGR